MGNSYGMGNIPPEKFRLVGIDEGLAAALPSGKSRGYFADAWERFRRNKASISALIIIICIVLFAIVTPFLGIVHAPDFLEPYYAKMSPRVASLRNSLGIMTGGVRRTASERRLIYLSSIGVGSMGKLGEVPTAAEVPKNLRAVLSYRYTREGVGGGRFYTAEIDSYLEVGFVYMNIDEAEYNSILEYEREREIDILFPLIQENEYCPDVSDANYWYISDASGNPLCPTASGMEKIELSPDMQLYGNYLFNGESPVYWRPSGSGDGAERTVRVLYYNYYRYKNGSTPDYILGTDSQGYDLAARVALGISLSLLLAVAVSAVNLVIGAVWGAVAGYFGGGVDLVMSRATDILSGIPAIVVQTLFQIHLAERVGALPSLLFAFILTGWIATALRVRGQFYRFRGEEYVIAARTLGASDARIIWRHIFPNTLGTLITASVLVIPGVIFTESMLSFLGIVNLGGANITSLGTLLSEAAGIWTTAPHLMLVPALVISLLMISFNLFGNGLRDALNPGLRGAS